MVSRHFVRMVSTVLAVSALSLLLSPFSGCTEPEPIRLGFVGGLSGRTADLAMAGRDGVVLAVEDRNRGGGVNGRQVKLVVRDDGQDPDKARQAARDLIEARVDAVVGPITSAMAMAMVDDFNRAGVVAVSPTVSSEALSGKDDFFFRVIATTRDHAGVLAEYLRCKAGLSRMAAVYDVGNRAYSENWVNNFRRFFEAEGGQVVKTVAFTSSDKVSFTDLARETLETGTEGILIIANSMDSALLCQQIRKSDSGIVLALSAWGSSEHLLSLGGKAVEGAVLVQAFSREGDTPQYQAFRRAYKERFNLEPGFAGVYAYEAANVILDALGRMKGGQSLKEAIMADPRFPGLQSSIAFDRFGDVERRHVSICAIKNGHYSVVD